MLWMHVTSRARLFQTAQHIKHVLGLSKTCLVAAATRLFDGMKRANEKT
jgi:hypothetical protein